VGGCFLFFFLSPAFLWWGGGGEKVCFFWGGGGGGQNATGPAFEVGELGGRQNADCQHQLSYSASNLSAVFEKSAARCEFCSNMSSFSYVFPDN